MIEDLSERSPDILEKKREGGDSCRGHGFDDG